MAATEKEWPRLVGAGSALEATHEIHIFLLPLNATDADLQRYYDAVAAWNAAAPLGTERMKACHLALVFRTPTGAKQVVRVMQSARYLRSNDQTQVLRECRSDADFFRGRGFEIAREKIEASAHGVAGVPLSDAEALRYPEMYFEFHVRLRRSNRADAGPASAEEAAQLEALACAFSRRYGVPVPLSYNLQKDQAPGDGQGGQRFLNMRFRGLGLNSVRVLVAAVEQAIAAEASGFEHVKTISEYVWSDTNCAMDKYWIDYGEGEFRAAYASNVQQ